jgi:hypothetical protein
LNAAKGRRFAMRRILQRRGLFGLLAPLLALAVAVPAAEVASASAGQGHAAKHKGHEAKKKKKKKKKKVTGWFFSGTTSQGYGVRFGLANGPFKNAFFQNFGIEVTCTGGSKRVVGPTALRISGNSSTFSGTAPGASVVGSRVGKNATGTLKVQAAGPDTGGTCQAEVTFTAHAK